MWNEKQSNDRVQLMLTDRSDPGMSPEGTAPEQRPPRVTPEAPEYHACSWSAADNVGMGGLGARWWW